MGKYLIGRSRYVVTFQRQGPNSKMHTQVDTDHAGCWKTRKSRSGGIIKFGRHTSKTWSLTQVVVALPPGEAEYYGMLQGTVFFR